jgi:hypothetical protein
VRIGKSMTVAAAEALLCELAQTPSPLMRIPTRSQHHQAGGEAAIVQALITWSQSVERPQLVTHVPDASDSDDQIGALTRQFFGLASSLLCDEAYAIDKSDLFTKVREAGLQRLSLIQSERARDASRGPQLEILCADHLNKSGARLLYDIDSEGQPTLKMPESFIFLAANIRRAVIPDQLSRVIPKGFDAALGNALYELFKNTEDHARVDDEGNKLKRSLRGIQARRHAIASEKLIEFVKGSPPLEAFCARLRPPRKKNRDIQLIEISVLDSGPGYASSITQKPQSALTPAEEAEAVRKCFLKHATSKSSSSSGLGLCNVVDILREHGGFLRLRSGRQSVYADLGCEKDAKYGTLPKLHDWPTGQTPPARVAGSLMTILLPLRVE